MTVCQKKDFPMHTHPNIPTLPHIPYVSLYSWISNGLSFSAKIIGMGDRANHCSKKSTYRVLPNLSYHTHIYYGEQSFKTRTSRFGMIWNKKTYWQELRIQKSSNWFISIGKGLSIKVLMPQKMPLGEGEQMIFFLVSPVRKMCRRGRTAGIKGTIWWRSL